MKGEVGEAVEAGEEVEKGMAVWKGDRSREGSGQCSNSRAARY